MEEDKVLSDETTDDVEEPRQGSGSMLAAARKQQQKTVEEIATELNLSVSQIKAIELDHSEGLPEPTYVRGYIRGYAKLLGLDAEDVLKNYLHSSSGYNSRLNDIPRGIGSAEDSSPSFFRASNMVVIALLLILLGGAWYSGLLNGLFSGPQDSGAVIQSTSELTIVSSEPSQASLTVSGQQAAGTDNTANPNDETSLAQVFEQDGGQVEAGASIANESPNEPAVGEGAASAGVQPANLNQLKIQFSQTSWVDIRDNADTRLVYKSYAAGEQLDVESESELSVFIGNADGVTVSFNGAPFDIAPHREGVYAKFVAGE